MSVHFSLLKATKKNPFLQNNDLYDLFYQILPLFSFNVSCQQKEPFAHNSLESTNCAVMTAPLGPLGFGVRVFALPGIIDHSSLTLVVSTTLPTTARSPQSSPAHAAETPPVGATTTLYSQQGEGRLSTAPDIIFGPSHVFITGYSHNIKTVCLPRRTESLYFLR